MITPKKNSKKTTEAVDSMTIYDQLSGLYNKHYFFHQLEMAVEQSKRKLSPLCVLLFCTDHLEEFNEALGLDENSQLITRLGEVIKTAVRKTDQAFRLEKAVFSVIIDSDLFQAKNFANRLKKILSKSPFLIENQAGQTISVYKTVSVGIAEFKFTEQFEELYRNASDAMFIANRNGGNRINIHQSYSS